MKGRETKMKGKATKLERMSNFRGEAYLYKVEPPMGYDMDYDTGEFLGRTKFVISSASVADFTGIETLVFPADKDGNVLSWLDIGGRRGLYDPDEALREEGYEVVSAIRWRK